MASLKALTLASIGLLGLASFAAAADLLPPPPSMEPPPPMISAPELGGWYLRGDVGVAANTTAPALFNSPDPLAGNYWGAGASQAFNNTNLSASTIFDLVPGDVIATGTPAGVGFTRKPPIFMKAGDVVEVEIEKIGVLRNPVVDE